MKAKAFGERIRERRAAEGLTQAQLAQEIGVSRNYLSQIERGEKQNPTWRVVENLTQRLGIEDVAEPDISELPDVSPSLLEFAQAAELPVSDIKMLMRISYRGRQPNTADKWQWLYNVIELATRP